MQMCVRVGVMVYWDGIEEATPLFTAALHVDWKQICWGMNVVGDEGTHRSSFGFPVNLGC